MTPKLSDEILQAIREHPGEPIKVVDPETEGVYYVVPDQQFQKVRFLFDEGPFDISETYRAQFEAMGKAGWDDPAMDVYDDYDAHKPKS